MNKYVSSYITVGVVAFVYTGTILYKDGKDSPFKIAAYSTLNGLLWPAAIVAAVIKNNEIKRR